MPVSYEDGMVCNYCGQKQEQITFFIGAKRDDDIGWTMHEGTGKISCPNCFPKGKVEAELIIKKYVEG